MQNKPNFRNDKMNTTFLLTKDYENEIVFMLTKNKPNQTQPVVSLPALSKAEVSNLPVVSLPALSKPVPSAVEGVEVSNLPVVSLPALSKVEVSNLPVVSLSNLFKRHTCLFRGLQTEDKLRGNDNCSIDSSAAPRHRRASSE